ncbi:MAG TPA: DNA-directed RNA polymerase subunit alpha C-terminal domain-containing protein [Candidatus Magasanikbacteria bacterium]|nr:DNA-directed RNA polymerase subunit alpha C-terminal domain-containing protein [Candidatus Magasanikbacteria bacterium]
MNEGDNFQKAEPSDDAEKLPTPHAPNLLRPVTELELSVRTGNLLKNAGIRLIGDLVQFSEVTLMKPTQRRGFGFGRKSIKELKDVLAPMAFSLDMSPNHPMIDEFNFRKLEQKDPD